MRDVYHTGGYTDRELAEHFNSLPQKSPETIAREETLRIAKEKDSRGEILSPDEVMAIMLSDPEQRRLLAERRDEERAIGIEQYFERVNHN
jgi:hypothetical protein